MSDISYPDKVSGNQVTALEMNQIKTAVNSKVDKVTGKGLSANDYTDGDKSTVNAIATGGTTGQVLSKASNADGDVAWTDQTGGDGGDSGTEEVAFNTALPLSRENTIMAKGALTANLVLAENATDKMVGGGGTLTFQQGTGAYTVTPPSGWVAEPASQTVDATEGRKHRMIWYYDGVDTAFLITRKEIAGIIETLSTPTFEVNAISDTEEALTNIVCDSDSEVMIIRRATNVGMSANLTTVYTGAPVTEYIDDELTPETTYSYDVQTTAAGFTDSARSAVDSDTTDAADLTPLAAPGSFTLTADEWGKATAAWANVTGNIGFSVQLATNAGFTTGVQSATKGTGVLSHQFTGLIPLTTYYGHSLAIGNGTTNSNSAYSTADSDTTPAATLNPATSFAAGTPTADGVPFTLVDTNSAPANESSAIIQIALAADTTYSGTIITRTLAANATSIAAGSGLAASTAYRARHQYIGNGTSTLDSAYSSEVTFTTDVAAGVDDVVYTSASFTFTNTAGVWETTWPTATFGATGIDSSKPLTGGSTGAFRTQFTAADAQYAVVAIDAGNTEQLYGSLAYGLYFGAGVVTVVDAGATINPNVVGGPYAPTIGEWYHIEVDGGTGIVTMSTSTTEFGSKTLRHTYSANVSGATLYPKCDFAGGGGAKVYYPRVNY